MRKDYFLSEREGLAVAMKQLRHFNIFALTRFDDSQYDEELLLKYFDADFESPINAQMEKIISAAVVSTVYEKDYIPNNWKRRVAEKAVREQVEALRSAKITYHKEVNEMSEREAQARLKENKIVQRVTVVDSIVKSGCRVAARTGISFGIGALVALITGGPVAIPAIVAYGVVSIIPKKVKDKVVEGCKKGVDTAVEVVRNTADSLAQKGVEVAQKAKTVIKEVASEVKETVKHAWEDGKKKVSKITNRIKNWLGF